MIMCTTYIIFVTSIFHMFALVISGHTFKDPNSDLYNNIDKAASFEHRRKVGWIDPYSFEDPYADFYKTEDKVILDNKQRNKEWKDPYDMSFQSNTQSSYKNLPTDANKKFSEVKESNQCEVNLQRLVNSFLRSTSLLKNDESVYDSSIRLHSSISPRDLKVLKLFADHGRGKGGVDIGDVSDIFHKIFVENLHYGKKEPSFLDKLQISLSRTFLKMAQSPELTVVSSVIAMLFATLWFVYKTHSYRLALFSLCITLFFGGFGFTWIRLYEEAEVERFVNIKLHGEVPYHCSGNPMMWYEHMYYRAFGVNCLEFYKSRDVRPIVKISPTDVLSETLSSMVIKPATNIGKAYGNFCHNVLGLLPWWLKPIAVPFTFLLPPLFFVLVLALFLNYRFSISITGFHLMPSWCGRREAALSENSAGYVRDVPSPRDSSMFSSIFSDSKTPLFLVNWSGLQKLSSGDLLAENKEEESTQLDAKDEEGVESVPSSEERQSIGYHTSKKSSDRGVTNLSKESSDRGDTNMSNESSDRGDTREFESSTSQSHSTKNCENSENEVTRTSRGSSSEESEEIAKKG